ncbi:protein kinase [Streptomyces sp. NBC_01476]|uniref:serine/threonine-protein kinase n=1 Tax=Streptomyces sp. NBC_01476 TaxID=2903881 RepID=UPI002E2EE98C|nr:serine/threonine-protein kinase [Streptomyces sp. NBC_01476]
MERLGAADPQSVGGYPLFARLGAGGMGQVYLARTPAGRALALKTVRSEFGLDPAFGERFAREIRHADRARSPWTVAVVDFSPPGTSPQWLATEYVAAPSLAEWVTAHGPLPAPSLTALAAELCEGLHTVHQAGLAHRDVKPSNVLLPGTRPLLIDFGIARAAEDSRHTRTGGVIGSPGYMAPEQATAGASAEPGDVFALGAVLVYAATGRGPFNRLGEEPSTPALLYRVVHEEPDLDGVPAEVLPLIRACLLKDPQERPTAHAALELLPAAERGTGGWAERQPPGLAADLRAREDEMRALLGEPAAQDPARPPMTAAATADAALGPSPYAPTTTRPAAYHPAYRTGPSAAAPVPGQARPGQSVPAQPGPSGPTSGGWGPVPPPARPPGASGGPHRRGPLIAGVAAAVVVLVLVGVLVDKLSGSGSDNAGSTGGGGGTPSTSAPSTASESADPDALPAAMVGTWTGSGPGDPNASGFQPATDSVKVTLTLRAGQKGSVVGQDIASISAVGTGAELGCTEQLLLTGVQGSSVQLGVSSARPTDPNATDTCLTENVYTLTLTDSRHMKLGLAGGTVANGAPDSLTKQ